MRTVLCLCLVLVSASACDGPRASIEIEDMRLGRDPEGRVVADLDVLAHEQLGGNVGVYCTRAIFPAEDPVERCDADLEDGDRRTIRFISLGRPGPGGLVFMRVRLAGVDAERSLGAP